MTSLALFLLLACFVQDTPETYRILLTLEADDAEGLEQTLTRGLSELPGVLKIEFSQAKTAALTMEMDTIVSRAEIEEILPRRIAVKTYRLEGLAGSISQVGGETLLKIPGMEWKLVLHPTDATRESYDAPDEKLMPNQGWAVWGNVEEKVVRKGGRLHVRWGITTERVAIVYLPKTPAREAQEEEKKQSIRIRVILHELKNGLESARAATDAVREIEGVVDAQYEPLGIVMTIWLREGQKIDVPLLRATVRRHATALQIFVDRVEGTVHARASGPSLRTRAGMEFRIEGKVEEAWFLLHEAARSEAKVTFRIAGEVVLVEEKILILARTVRSWE